MVDDHVFPQDSGWPLTDQAARDWADAGNLAALGYSTFADSVLAGFTISEYDIFNDTVDVSDGMAVVTVENITTRTRGTESYTWPLASVPVTASARTLQLAAGTYYNIYLDIQTGSGLANDVDIVAVEEGVGTPPAAPSLHIGWADTTAETTGEVNRLPDAGFDTLSAESAPTAQTDVARLAETSANAADIDTVRTDLTNHTGATTAHGSNGLVAGMNDLYTDTDAQAAAAPLIENHRTDEVHAQLQPANPASLDGTTLIPNTLQLGEDAAETITETVAPKSFEFTAGINHDLHDGTDVTLSNASGASATEDITVDLYAGVDTTGTLLASELRSVTVADATTVTETFIDPTVDRAYATSLGAATDSYHIEVTQSGTALSVDQTDEHTLAAAYPTTQDDAGDAVTTDHRGRERARHDAVENRVEYERVGVRSAPQEGTDVMRRTDTWAEQGDVVELDSISSNGLFYNSGSTTPTDPTNVDDRAIANWTDKQYANITEYRVEYGIYRFHQSTTDETAYMRLRSYGTAPNPVPGTEVSVVGGPASPLWREFVTAPIDITNFGQWTPSVDVWTSDVTATAGEVQIRGPLCVRLLGVIG